VSAFAVEEARRRVPDTEFAVAPAGQVPFDGPFDVVAAFDVLEHVVDLDGALETTMDRLAPRGALVFVVPVYDGPTGPLIRALDKDETHVHKQSRRFWLERVGRRLHVEEWWGVYRYLFPGRVYAHWPTRALRAWTPAIAVVARSG
jgi:SAM-dependent methyltransferase